MCTLSVLCLSDNFADVLMTLSLALLNSCKFPAELVLILNPCLYAPMATLQMFEWPLFCPGCPSSSCILQKQTYCTHHHKISGLRDHFELCCKNSTELALFSTPVYMHVVSAILEWQLCRYSNDLFSAQIVPQALVHSRNRPIVHTTMLYLDSDTTSLS